MSRAVYPFALVLTLGLLATMWLRPGFAQELIEIAGRIRAQSPDRYGQVSPAAGTATPQDPFSQVPYDSVARPPMQPVPVTRPVSWPGTSVQSAASADPQSAAPASPADKSGVQVWDPSGGRYAMPPAAQQPQPSYQSPANLPPPAASPPTNQFPAAPNFDAQNLQVWPSPPKDLPDTQKVAQVGREVILLGDLRAVISDHLYRTNTQIPPEALETVYQQAYRPMLKQLIEIKLIYNDALNTIPKEALPNIEADINDGFNKQVLPRLLESHGAINAQELDRKMQERGSSLDFMKRHFFEQTFAQEWKKQKINTREEVPHSEVLGYYRSHSADYEFPAKARWEELMVRFDRYPDKASAYAAIANMGNAVQQGAPFAEVAKANSQGLTAHEGGQWDWTTKDSLTTKIIDQAIFGLPVGGLSQIIETDRGFHIVRVIERTEAGRRPYIDVQSEIKKQLKEQRIQKQVDDYLTLIRNRTQIWTMFDNEPGGLDGIQEERRSIYE